jgi:hypothetical protein
MLEWLTARGLWSCSKVYSAFILCAAAGARCAGPPAPGNPPPGNTRAAPSATVRNFPPGASTTIARPAGPRSSCGWALLRTAAPLAAATSPASGDAKKNSPGGTRSGHKRRPKLNRIRRLRVRLLGGHAPGVARPEKEDCRRALREGGTRNKKWFQVTRWIARSPTGMHGLNMASGSDVT